jgi:hypothetical protein
VADSGTGAIDMGTPGSPSLILPGDPGYREAALSAGNYEVLFASGQVRNGQTASLNLELASDRAFALYMVQNASTASALASLGDGDPGNDISVWFPFQAANADDYTHFRPTAPGDPGYRSDVDEQYGIEDLSPTLPNPRGYKNDGDYNDAVVSYRQIRFEAVDDWYVIGHDRTLTELAPGVMLNDDLGDQGSGSPQVTLTSGPQFGTLTEFNSDGSFEYVAPAGFVGTDTFEYELSDGTITSEATVSVVVQNRAPIAVDDFLTLPEDPSLGVTFSTDDLLVNDNDIDDDAPTFVSISSPSVGVLVDHLDGTYTYYPAGDGTTGVLEYVISDGYETDTAQVQFLFFQQPGALPNYSVDIKIAAFIPKSLGTTVNWDTAPNAPLDALAWAEEPASLLQGAVDWYFSVDDRERAGEQGTSRLFTIGTFNTADLGSFGTMGTDITTTNTGESHRFKGIRAGGGISAFKHTIEVEQARPTFNEERRDLPGARSSVLEISAGAGYPFIPSPEINYEVEFTFTQLANGDLDVRYSGWHDAFPAYEIIINDAIIHSYRPTATGPTPFNLGGFVTIETNGRTIIPRP